jgi:phosphoglycolate phosphatase-like HAD superfamily hydrolase
MKLKDKHPCFVFDLDGTLCDVSHRRQWVATKPKNWDAWNAGISEDKPNTPVLETLRALSRQFDIVLVSGRGSEYRAVTVDWLRAHEIHFSALYMRAEGDHRPDDEIKSELADEVEKTYKVLGVFDDRKRVVDMWIKRGIFVFDVGQGKANF